MKFKKHGSPIPLMPVVFYDIFSVYKHNVSATGPRLCCTPCNELACMVCYFQLVVVSFVPANDTYPGIHIFFVVHIVLLTECYSFSYSKYCAYLLFSSGEHI